MAVDQLIEAGLSNAGISLALALVALVAERAVKHPQLSYMLWLLVFIKLVTVPLITVSGPTVAAGLGAVAGSPDYAYPAAGDLGRVGAARLGDWSALLGYAEHGLPWLWLLGSVVVLLVSLVRIYRFNRLLVAGSELGPQALQASAAKVAERLGLRTCPAIYLTAAEFSPMVWWVGGRVRVVVPAALFERMEAGQFQWILAHELAHVRRRDYLVRWLEWLVTVCFWWNPIVWWARSHLRANEEICCDALVVSSLGASPKVYAHSLLTAVEHLALPRRQAMALASQINSYGFLERRLRMIMSKTNKRLDAPWLKVGVLILALAVLPLGITYAVADGGGGDRAVEAKEQDGDGAGEEGKTEAKGQDGDGEVSLEEKDRAAEQRAAWLKRLDTDRDGKISPAEEARYAKEMEDRDAEGEEGGTVDRLEQERRGAEGGAIEEVRWEGAWLERGTADDLEQERRAAQNKKEAVAERLERSRADRIEQERRAAQIKKEAVAKRLERRERQEELSLEERAAVAQRKGAVLMAKAEETAKELQELKARAKEFERRATYLREQAEAARAERGAQK